MKGNSEIEARMRADGYVSSVFAVEAYGITKSWLYRQADAQAVAQRRVGARRYFLNTDVAAAVSSAVISPPEEAPEGESASVQP